MGFIALLVSFLAAVFMFVGLIPFLGWLNWFTTLPLAVAGAVLSILTLREHPRSLAGIGGIILSLVVMFVAVTRLTVGCGVI